MIAHLKFLSKSVKGFLIPGSTGDGWALNDEESRFLLEIAFEQAKALKFQFLVGVLKPSTSECLKTIWERIEWLKSKMSEFDAEKAMATSNICGFAVCAPAVQKKRNTQRPVPRFVKKSEA